MVFVKRPRKTVNEYQKPRSKEEFLRAISLNPLDVSAVHEANGCNIESSSLRPSPAAALSIVETQIASSQALNNLPTTSKTVSSDLKESRVLDVETEIILLGALPKITAITKYKSAFDIPETGPVGSDPNDPIHRLNMIFEQSKAVGTELEALLSNIHTREAVGPDAKATSTAGDGDRKSFTGEKIVAESIAGDKMMIIAGKRTPKPLVDQVPKRKGNDKVEQTWGASRPAKSATEMQKQTLERRPGGLMRSKWAPKH